MNMFFVSLLVLVLFLALIGWLTHWTHAAGGDAQERYFRAFRALLIAGLFLALSFVANYYLASTGLQRSLGAEKLGRKDPFGALLFAGSGMRSNHLFALMLVAASFIAVGYFLKYVGLVFEAVRTGSWRQGRTAFALLLFRFALITVATAVFVWADTSLLLFRTATMMWTEELSTTAASLPTPDRIIDRHAGTMGANLLSIFMVWYPLYIILAEKHFASCMAHFRQASEQWATAKRQAEAAAAPGAPAAAGGTPAPDGPLPRGAMPIPPPPGTPGPFGPVPPGGPAGPAPGPAPGGAGPWVRAIPFNPGPQNGNGRSRVES